MDGCVILYEYRKELCRCYSYWQTIMISKGIFNLDFQLDYALEAVFNKCIWSDWASKHFSTCSCTLSHSGRCDCLQLQMTDDEDYSR